MLTVTDLFAGAGGSSTGMVAVPGVEVKIAANHWKVAIDIHNTNHPTTDHAIADLHQADPHYFPRTDILWASPECTKWSQANGSPLPDIDEGLFEDPLSSEAADRSRMLMFDVPRFMAVHRDTDTDARCTHDSGHEGDHGDGDRWWDGHGLQTPRDQPAALPAPDPIPARKSERRARLTDEQAAEIRRRHNAGWTKTAIARDFGLNYSTVWSIVNHLTYRSAG